MTKKRIFAFIGIILILCSTILCAFPASAETTPEIPDLSEITFRPVVCPTHPNSGATLVTSFVPPELEYSNYHIATYKCTVCDYRSYCYAFCHYSFVGIDGSSACDKCGMLCIHRESSFREIYSPTDSTHHQVSGNCIDCSWLFGMYTEACTFVDGVCKCGNISNVCTHSNFTYSYTYNDSSTHSKTKKCVDCGQIISTESDYHIYNGGSCVDCDYNCTHPSTTLAYNHADKASIKVHGIEVRCIMCSEQVDSLPAELCTIVNGACTVCRYVYEVIPEETETETETTPIETPCEHSSQKFTYTYVDENKCRWVVSCYDCNEVISDTIIEHHFLNGACDCGYECPHGFENDIIFHTPLGNGEHNTKQTCGNCGKLYVDENMLCMLNNGVCTVCGYGCIHSTYVENMKNITQNTHKKYKTCTDCNVDFDVIIEGCSFVDDKCSVCNNYCLHSYGYTVRYTSQADYTHIEKYYCNNCSFAYNTAIRDCEFVNNKCKYCTNIYIHTHEYNVERISLDYLYQSATCLQNAIWKKSCVCGETFDASLEIYDINANPSNVKYYIVGNKGGHYYANGTCRYCGIEYEITFEDMFTGIYDGMLNVFYKMTSFDILGYNIANLILSIFTLIVVIIIAKKVL